LAPIVRKPLLLVLALLVWSTAAAAQQRSGIDLSSLDTSVRPQDDLWRFANGKWLAATTIPSDRPGWDTFTALRDTTQAQLRALIDGIDPQTPDAERRKLADLYGSFMDEQAVAAAGLAGLKPELERIAALADKAALPALFAELAPLRVRTPFDLYVAPDAHDPSVYIAHLTQGGLGLPDRDYYLRDEPHFQAMRTAYRAHIARLLALAGVNSGEAEADRIIALETVLARLQWTRVQNRDPIKTYNRRRMGELPAVLGNDGWRAYFAAARAEVRELVVAQPSYIEGVGQVIDETPLSTWRAWLAYNLLSSYAPDLPAAFVDEQFAFAQRTLRGVPENLPRWKRGVALVDRQMGFALGKLYVERHFPPAAKAHAESMITHLTAVYAESLATLDWMGPQTRQQALAKLKAIAPRIGYPDKWRDYDGLTIRRDDLVGNVMRASRFEAAFWLAKIGQKVDRSEWRTTPQTVNAFYSATRNEIIFPAGILQPPFFDAGAEDAANYGGIGTVIGHELSHGFDDQGSRYDGAGMLRNWWTAEDRERFDAKGQRMAAQYDAFSPLPGYHVNGRLTLGENIADNAGLAMAVRAYRHALGGGAAPTLDGYSGEQRLFIAFAQIWKQKVRDAAQIERLKTDPHSPGQFRANGATRNQGAFVDAFGLKPGDAMYLPPDERVSLW
jgi:predicted metalloendopeptidase